MAAPDKDILLNRAGGTEVYRRGGVIAKTTGPWTPAVHSLLRHLEAMGFAGAPRLVGSGFDGEGHELLTFVEGEEAGARAWSLEGAAGVGRFLRELHDAAASFRPSPDVVWQRWFGRPLGGPRRIISHCDVAPWNIIARNGLPVALIDWEHAGPVDPLVELAQACWLNARLFDDELAAREGLPSREERAKLLRAIVDGYGLSAARRRRFVDRMITFAICDTAEQADEAGITGETTEVDTDALGYDPLWALTWRARSAAWMCRHRRTLQNALA